MCAPAEDLVAESLALAEVLPLEVLLPEGLLRMPSLGIFFSSGGGGMYLPPRRSARNDRLSSESPL